MMTTTDTPSPIIGDAPSLVGLTRRKVTDAQTARRERRDQKVDHKTDQKTANGHTDEPPIIRQLVTSGVETVARRSVVVGKDMIRTAPRDALMVARAGHRAARPVVRAVADRAFAGVPDVDGVAQMGANAVARGFARLASFGWLSNNWGRYAKWRTSWER